MIKSILYIILLFLALPGKAQTYESPLLTNGNEAFTLNPGKNNAYVEFFVADSVCLFFENSDYKTHSFVLTINKSKKISDRFYAPKGIVKGSALSSIMSNYFPCEIKFSEVKIKYGNEIMQLPYDYIFTIR